MKVARTREMNYNYTSYGARRLFERLALLATIVKSLTPELWKNTQIVLLPT